MIPRILPLIGGSIALLAIALGACATTPSDARITVDAPDRSQFDPVGAFLDHRCGSLDCHGSAQRNMIIYGCEGLRIDPNDVPGCRVEGGKNTTEPEYDATYRSVVGLEPTVMSAVVASGGAQPELLTMIRKARGMESHKGGVLITPGDDQDTCIISWLQGATDTAACTQAISDTP